MVIARKPTTPAPATTRATTSATLRAFPARSTAVSEPIRRAADGGTPNVAPITAITRPAPARRVPSASAAP